jgi:hypothetical protein
MTDIQQALGALKALSEQIHEQQVRAEERLKAQEPQRGQTQNIKI